MKCNREAALKQVKRKVRLWEVHKYVVACVFSILRNMLLPDAMLKDKW